MDRLEAKVDKILDKLEIHSVLLERHTQFHLNAERQANVTEKDVHRLKKDMESALLPIKAAKFIVSLAAGIGVLVALAKAFSG